jgi:hypothetical protein
MRYAFVIAFLILVRTSINLEEEMRTNAKFDDSSDTIYCTFGDDLHI